ncbi:MAG: hypothetical protein RL153_1580, partial [Verrucomicrobiota bacterium]
MLEDGTSLASLGVVNPAKCLRWLARFLLLASLLHADGAEAWKTLRLRNETIRTPAKASVAAAPGRVEAPTADGLYLVQLEGALRPSWRDALAAAGVDLAYYVPEDGFIAFLRGARLAAVRSLDFVRWVGPLKPRHKVHASVVRALG